MGSETYIPALRFHWLTPLYDTVVGMVLREKSLRKIIVEQIDPKPAARILDLGCGTGTLSLLLKKTYPEIQIVGLDIDPAVLEIARRKQRTSGLDVAFIEGDIDSLIDEGSFTPNAFDHVVSSFVFHHLSRDQKRRTLDAVLQVLRPGARLLLVDFGKPANVLLRAGFLLVQLLDGFATTSDNVRGDLPRFVDEAGFVEVSEGPSFSTALGSVSFIAGRKPKTPLKQTQMIGQG